MATPKKWYAVRKGRKAGIFETWKECQAQVIGFPGAEFKSFLKEEDAQTYMQGGSVQSGKVYAVRSGNQTGLFPSWSACLDAISGYPNPVYKSFKNEDEARAWLAGKDYWQMLMEEDDRNGVLTAYCDGSFNQRGARYGWGVAMVWKGRTITRSGAGSETDYLESRNVAGEIMGALAAMEFALENGISQVRIYHDYAGLAYWICGEWKANKPLSQMYVSTYQTKYADKMKVCFQKVPAHTGVALNEMADALAWNAAFDGHRPSGDAEAQASVTLI